MYKSTHLGEIMETTCNQCSSRFRLTEKQLKQAYGKVRCGECGCVFNALQGLKNYEGELPADYYEQLEDDLALDKTLPISDFENHIESDPSHELSLHEAMYGSERRPFFSLGPLGWFIGIILLAAVGVAQAIYYQRYQLIEDPRYQQQVINLCELLPCAETAFASTEQLKLLERNVFTHPVASDALMVTGSFTNKAPFAQKLPDMLISLFDVQGKLIANRMFTSAEYRLDDNNKGVIKPQAIVQFRLEIIDPGTDALTYEFEFF
ncbi:MAG: zinc-ribbon domain-containing protein [Gammaproteobacteria bacterium]|nr:zinc-ribbon domain-containing protein [Gammaproteobacteria bacterium]